MDELKLSSMLLRCINEIGDYFEYAYKSEEDKKFVIERIDKLTSDLKERSQIENNTYRAGTMQRNK